MKSKLLPLVGKLLEKIEAGDDFIVTSYEFGRLTKIPMVKEDVEPHICDFKKANIDMDLVAYYFAYLICTPGYEVYSVKDKKYLQADAKPTHLDRQLIRRFEDNFLDKAFECRTERLNKKQEEETR